MKEKPILFNLLAILYLIIAIAMPVQIIYLYGHKWNDFQLIYHKLSLFNWFVILGCLYNSVALFQAKFSLKFSIPINLIIISINNWFVSFVGVDYSHTQTQFATIGLTLISSMLVFSKTMNIINDQKLIWWKWATRVKKEVPVTVVLNHIDLYQTHTYDLSRTGAYLEYEQDKESDPNFVTGRILKGETINLILGDPKSADAIYCKARIVRKSNKRGAYPEGIGINFESLSLKNVFSLFKLLYSDGNRSPALSQ